MNPNLQVKGILSHKPIIGPKIFQIDLTKNCNIDCVGCWCHSDLLGSTKFSPSEKKEFISFSLVKKLVDDLSKLKVERIILAGPGEPLLHPNIKEIISYIKKKNIFLEIITNFTIVNDSFIDLFIKHNVDQLTVSVWAGNAETYVKTHPKQSKKLFEQIKNKLIILNNRKENYPIVKLYNVISSRNYTNIIDMISFARDTLSDYVEFQVIETIPGKTDDLVLPSDAYQKIKKQFSKAKKLPGYIQFNQKNRSSEQQEFGRYISLNHFKPYFKYHFDNNNLRVTCKKNKTHIMMSYDHDFENSLFYFDPFSCKNCSLHDSCFITKSNYSLSVPYTIVLGYGSFMRRVSSSKKDYDAEIINEIPCYIGYIYGKSLVNGNIIPCCKGDSYPLGNLQDNSFKEIWFSKKYQSFRKLASITNNKSFDPFNKIGCTKCCDNLGMILEVDEKLRIYKEIQQNLLYSSLKKNYNKKEAQRINKSIKRK